VDEDNDSLLMLRSPSPLASASFAAGDFDDDDDDDDDDESVNLRDPSYLAASPRRTASASRRAVDTGCLEDKQQHKQQQPKQPRPTRLTEIKTSFHPRKGIRWVPLMNPSIPMDTLLKVDPQSSLGW
jgi:hypothetical protein